MFQFEGKERNRKKHKKKKNSYKKAPIELLKRPAEEDRRKYRLIVETVKIKIKKNYDNEIKKQKQILLEELQKKKLKLLLTY